MLSRFTHVQLSVMIWTVAGQAPLSVRFSRQEYWSGLPFPSPENLPNPGIEPLFLISPALAGQFFTTGESEVTQSCPTLCDPMDCSLPGSSVHGVFQARVLEWVAISFSRVPPRNSIYCIIQGGLNYIVYGAILITVTALSWRESLGTQVVCRWGRAFDVWIG